MTAQLPYSVLDPRNFLPDSKASVAETRYLLWIEPFNVSLITASTFDVCRTPSFAIFDEVLAPVLIADDKATSNFAPDLLSN